jgi:hypothetical protein
MAVNVDLILQTLNRHQVAYLLIGGMNFLLRHQPVLTYDVDIWIDDQRQNRARCEAALAELQAEWGPSDNDWKPVHEHPPDWLARQPLFCLTSAHGAIDVFRQVAGLDDWSTAAAAARWERTAAGVEYLGLSDEDMLRCQLALEAGQRKQDRIATLQRAIAQGSQDGRS